jgi:NAD(P)-dependent dehydrogenase (short-subunit alcohol dehydrogenase family)
MRLSGRTAFVTGGNTGIGAAIVRRLAAEGASVGLAYFEDAAAAEALVAELEATGARSVAVPCDVRDRGSVQTAVASVAEALGPVDVLVNNAGVLRHTPFLEISPEEWRLIFATNVEGAFHCIQACLPAMLERGEGCIVNVASELALVGEPLLVHYSASKAALIGLTKALAREVGPLGVRVNAVAPGPTDTRILTEEERSEAYAARLPLRRLGRPEEIAATVAFLSSADASWYAGQVLSPNGGAVM